MILRIGWGEDYIPSLTVENQKPTAKPLSMRLAVGFILCAQRRTFLTGASPESAR